MKLIHKAPTPAVGPYHPPTLEYETTLVKTVTDEDTEKLDAFLNAKAENGWRLQELHRVSDGKYFIVLFKIKGEVMYGV
jgi:hypothetical protein